MTATSEQRASELVELCKTHGFKAGEGQSLNEFITQALSAKAQIQQVLGEMIMAVSQGKNGAIGATNDGGVILGPSARFPKGVTFGLHINTVPTGHTVLSVSFAHPPEEPPLKVSAEEINELEEKAAIEEPSLLVVPGGRA